MKGSECYQKESSILRIRVPAMSITDSESGKIMTEECPLDSHLVILGSFLGE